jgi:hypothetical protein
MIQWRPEVNPLTTPPSYRIRFVPRGTADAQDIAGDVSRSQPNFSPEAAEAVLSAEDEAILARLLSGEQVTKRGSFSYYLTFTGRMDNPDDPLPPLEECLQVSVRVSQTFLERLRQAAQTERLPMSEKLTTSLHCNGQDVWVISKRWQSNGYMAWLVTGTGVTVVPVQSFTGFTPNIPNGVSYGQLKSSPSGTKIAAAFYGFAGQYGNTAEICDFNKATGVVSGAISLGTITGAYGIEWSPNGEIL